MSHGFCAQKPGGRAQPNEIQEQADKSVRSQTRCRTGIQTHPDPTRRLSLLSQDIMGNLSCSNLERLKTLTETPLRLIMVLHDTAAKV